MCVFALFVCFVSFFVLALGVGDEVRGVGRAVVVDNVHVGPRRGVALVPAHRVVKLDRLVLAVGRFFLGRTAQRGFLWLQLPVGCVEGARGCGGGMGGWVRRWNVRHRHGRTRRVC